MTYTVTLTNGNVLAVIPDGTLNNKTTMTLFGKNYPDYGEFLDDNLVHLLENSANNLPPPAPLVGQLWWDSTSAILKVWNGNSFKTLGNIYTGPNAPQNPVTGDLWYDTTNESLNVFNGSNWLLVGPSVINGTGTQPAVIADTAGVNHNVLELLVGTNIVGIVSKDPTFTPNVGIPGYTTIGPGYNQVGSVGGVPQYFQGTATNSLLLGGYDAAAFMTTVGDTGTTGNISILNNGGLTTGPNQNFKFFNQYNDGVIENTYPDGNIIINLNNGSGQANAAVFYGNGTAGFGNLQANYLYGDGSNISNINIANVPGAGTVTSVATATGLYGGPITSSGTIGLDIATPATIGGGALGGVIPDGLTVQMTPSGVISATLGPIGQPTVSGFAPIHGPVTGGTLVDITGTFFTGATAVTIAGVSAAHFAIVSPTQIIAVTAPGPVTSGAIVVTTPGGSGSSRGSFTYLADVDVTSFSPISSPITGGTVVTINGANFNNVTGVSFAGVPAASFAVHSPNQMTAITAPASGDLIGPIAVTTNTGAALSTDSFAYVTIPKSPTITSFTPTSGPVTGGTSIAITGTNLTGVLAVFVNEELAASFTVVSDTQVTVVTGPTSGPGTGAIQLITIHGTAISTSHFTYYNQVTDPTISFFSPTSGPISGGTEVIITGTNLSGATAVTVAGVPAASYSITSSTEIVAITAPAANGPGVISVTTPGGTVNSSFEYTYYITPGDPTISSFTPTAGPTTGGTQVVITGTNLNGISVVSYADVAASHFAIQSPTQIAGVTSPSPSVSGPVNVSGLFGGATSSRLFTYAAIPVITSFSPVSGPQSGNTPIVVVGNNFAGVTSGQVVGNPALDVTVVNGTIVELTTPPGPAGSGVISVTNMDGTGVSTQTYTYSGVAPNGTVTSVAAGPGLISSTGAAPITTSGTLSLAKAVSAVGGSGGSIGGVTPDGVTITMDASGVITSTGNYTNANVAAYLASGTVSTNIQTSAYFIGNGSQLTGLPAGYTNSDVANFLASGGDTQNIITSATVSGGAVNSAGSPVLTTANWNTVVQGGSAGIGPGYRYYVTAPGQYITLPGGPTVGTVVTVAVGQNNVNSVVGANGQNIMGLSEDMTINVANIAVTMEFMGGAIGWQII